MGVRSNNIIIYMMIADIFHLKSFLFVIIVMMMYRNIPIDFPLKLWYNVVMERIDFSSNKNRLIDDLFRTSSKHIHSFLWHKIMPSVSFHTVRDSLYPVQFSIVRKVVNEED